VAVRCLSLLSAAGAGTGVATGTTNDQGPGPGARDQGPRAQGGPGGGSGGGGGGGGQGLLPGGDERGARSVWAVAAWAVGRGPMAHPLDLAFGDLGLDLDLDLLATHWWRSGERRSGEAAKRLRLLRIQSPDSDPHSAFQCHQHSGAATATATADGRRQPRLRQWIRACLQ
jgi:hypothetical protein